MNIYLGVDPGVNGGIAAIGFDRPIVYNMPETLMDLWDVFMDIKNLADAEGATLSAFLESVSSSPQQGVKSAFTFGQIYGKLEMAITAAGIPLNRVRPQVWQKAMGCMTKGDKNVSKRKAQELFPSIKITHKIADALLIAKYGKMMEKA